MIDELTNLKGAENMAVLLTNFISLFLYVAHIWFYMTWSDKCISKFVSMGKKNNVMKEQMK